MGAFLSAPKRSAKDQVVLITGCSTGGIGSALAKEFQARGATVYATSRKVATMEGLEAQGVHTLAMDITSEESIKEAVDAIAKAEGRIDVLVNNAGISLGGPVAETPLALWRRVYETNVLGAVSVSQAVFPVMAGNRRGRILNIGSVAGMCHRPWFAVYSSSKAALHCITDCMRMEFKPFGIDVTLVCPGYIKTNIFSNALDNLPPLPTGSLFAPYEHLYRGHYEEKTNDPKNTPAEEFASEVVDYALNPKASWRLVTGRISWLAVTMSYMPVWLSDRIMWSLYSNIHVK